MPDTDERYGLIGHSVARSRSPLIHRAFGAQFNASLVYELIDVPTGAVERTVRRFFAEGGRGLNVTVPHKGEAFLCADEVAMRARVAGAVNTFSIDAQGTLIGDNTDGTGLVRDLVENLGVGIRDANVLLIGAGGAARGALAPLLGQGPATLTVANRTADKATHLAGTFAGIAHVTGTGLPALAGRRFDLVVNATAAGIDAGVPALPADAVAGAVCYDMNYGDGDTPFTTWARHHGAARAHTGWGMLVEQAAESFYLWRGVWPDTAPLLQRQRNTPPL